MSAECGKCGFDIVYPPGTWPVGECLNCKQAESIEHLREELMRCGSLAVSDRVDGCVPKRNADKIREIVYRECWPND